MRQCIRQRQPRPNLKLSATVQQRKQESDVSMQSNLATRTWPANRRLRTAPCAQPTLQEPAARGGGARAGRAAQALLVAVLTAAGVAAEAPAAAAQSVELAWKLEAGTDLVYRTAIRTETELPQGMGTSTMNMDTIGRWSVLEVDGDGNATVRMTTERVRMSLSGPMGTMTVDSANESGSGSSALAAVTAMAGTSYSVVLDRKGRMIEMSGLDDLREALGARTSDPSLRAVLDQTLSEETLRGQWELGMTALPVDTVGVGSTWENNVMVSVPPAGSMTAAFSNEVESIEGDLVVIGGSGAMSVSDGSAAPFPTPTPVSLGDATLTGRTRFDAGRGLLLDTETTIAVQMSMALGGRETVMVAATTVTVELVEE